MIRVRPAGERGRSVLDWLDSRHTFSFDRYFDPEHMGFRALRVLNEDRVRPGGGFDTHGHRDMEILTYVLDGALRHGDSLGNGSVIRPGEIQRMSAGRGVMHSERNASGQSPVHFLQIWILPERRGLDPSYEQRRLPADAMDGRLLRIAGPPGSDAAVILHQDAELHAGFLAPGQPVSHRLRAGRHAWIQVARGAIDLDGHALAAGDGAAVSEESGLDISAREPAEVLLFDLG